VHPYGRIDGRREEGWVGVPEQPKIEGEGRYLKRCQGAGEDSERYST